MPNISARETPTASGATASVLTLPATVLDAALPDAVRAAHHAGRAEAVAQALALIGTIEGTFRTDADGDIDHPSFTTAELLRHVQLSIREEVFDPTSRSALEVAARAHEASQLSDYVLEFSTQYADTDAQPVLEVLTHVAGDIRKGTEGVNRLRAASNVGTDPDVLRGLVVDDDADVRWWAAQNPTTPAEGLLEALGAETHAMVLAALIINPRVPVDNVRPFAAHSQRDVSAVARRRLGDEDD